MSTINFFSKSVYMSTGKIRYRNRYYGVIEINYKGNKLPVVIDWDDYKKIKKMSNKWRYNSSGFVSCNYNNKDVSKVINLHDVIKFMNEGKIDDPNIIHLNRIGLDNRRDNLSYDIKGKEHKKSMSKKKRTKDLPVDSGISKDELPTFIWYMKPDASHGERFVVNVGDVNWKSTSSVKVDLREKLEDAKKHLRKLKVNRGDLFTEYSMNGDYTEKGKELLESYLAIVKKVGYNFSKDMISNNTYEYLKEYKK